MQQMHAAAQGRSSAQLRFQAQLEQGLAQVIEVSSAVGHNQYQSYIRWAFLAVTLNLQASAVQNGSRNPCPNVKTLHKDILICGLEKCCIRNCLSEGLHYCSQIAALLTSEPGC